MGKGLLVATQPASANTVWVENPAYYRQFCSGDLAEISTISKRKRSDLVAPRLARGLGRHGNVVFSAQHLIELSKQRMVQKTGLPVVAEHWESCPVLCTTYNEDDVKVPKQIPNKLLRQEPTLDEAHFCHHHSGRSHPRGRANHKLPLSHRINEVRGSTWETRGGEEQNCFVTLCLCPKNEARKAKSWFSCLASTPCRKVVPRGQS